MTTLEDVKQGKATKLDYFKDLYKSATVTSYTNKKCKVKGMHFYVIKKKLKNYDNEPYIEIVVYSDKSKSYIHREKLYDEDDLNITNKQWWDDNKDTNPYLLDYYEFGVYCDR